MTVLAGDLGGTKTLLSLVDAPDSDDGVLQLLCTRQYDSRSYDSLEGMVAMFLADAEVRQHPAPTAAGFGVAGPVSTYLPTDAPEQGRTAAIEQRAAITNLGYVIDTASLRGRFGFARVRLANDFYAVAMYVSRLSTRLAHHGLTDALQGEVLLLSDPSKVQPDPLGTVSVLGAGTGMGQALIVRSDGGLPLPRPVIVSTEGGHTDFAPRDEVEIEFLRFLLSRHPDHVSVERVVCGGGLYTLYEFFRLRQPALENPAVRDEITRAGIDAPAVVSRHALAGDDVLCERALSRFVMLYGSEAGNLALKSLSTGGVFIGGGVGRKILPRMQDGLFWEHFVRKGRFRVLCERMPVYLLLDPLAGLRGAAYLVAP